MLVKALIRKRSRAIKSAWIRLIERSNLERASAIHLTSQLEAAELAHFGWKLPPCVVIPNGVEDPLARMGQVADDIRMITAAQPLVLFLGRLSWKKGLDRLLRGFARAQAGTLAIVGNDDEALAPKLRMLAADLGITDRVRILPRTVIGVEKEHLFAAARLFVLSSYSENFGNSVLEAMRRGIPIVTTPEVGAADIVQRSGGGVVAQSDQEPLGHAMDQFLQDASLARSMGEAGQRYVIANYSWGRIAAQMEDLYQRLHS
jgi:glycosyltransferase involved in cell wall biosynthesis